LKNCPYDAVKDFSAVAGIADIPHVLVVRRGLEAEMSARSYRSPRKSPRPLNYASTGVGSASHLAAECSRPGPAWQLQHIPFRGSAPMTTELLAGRIDLTFATLPSVISHIDTGAVRALRRCERQARAAAAEPADARGSRRPRRRGRRLVRACLLRRKHRLRSLSDFIARWLPG
jgi:tripartite-type tricarboxylate transporter receptor subunit TctC